MEYGEWKMKSPRLATQLFLRRGPHRRNIHSFGVFLDHAAGAEDGGCGADGLFDQMGPAARDAVAVAVEIERRDLVFERAVERLGVGVVAGFVTHALWQARINRPAIATLVSFIPPSVQDAQMGHAVKRGLLTTGAAGLHRQPRVVEPDVNAAHEVFGDVNVVILDKGDSPAEPVLAREVINLADQVAAQRVGRMRLAGEDDLHGAPLIVEYLFETLDIPED